MIFFQDMPGPVMCTYLLQYQAFLYTERQIAMGPDREKSLVDFNLSKWHNEQGHK